MNRQEKADFVLAQLEAKYGPIDWADQRHAQADPVDELIGTILSANTTGKNAGAAFRNLQTAFGNDWDRVRVACEEEVIDAIRVAGMYHQKAPRIQAALKRIRQDRGEYNLDYVAAMEVEQALDYLQGFPGIGHKTASIVLLFCFNMPTFPVDTHLRRISGRLGISRVKANPTQVTRDWEPRVAPKSYYQLHIHLIRLGRELCKARNPVCELCPLQDGCDYFLGINEWKRGRTPPK